MYVFGISQAHDESVELISKASSIERHAGDPARGVEALEDDPDDGEIMHRPGSGLSSGLISGVKDTGATLEKLARQVHNYPSYPSTWQPA